jgi:hypothetical protein
MFLNTLLLLLIILVIHVFLLNTLSKSKPLNEGLAMMPAAPKPKQEDVYTPFLEDNSNEAINPSEQALQNLYNYVYADNTSTTSCDGDVFKKETKICDVQDELKREFERSKKKPLEIPEKKSVGGWSVVGMYENENAMNGGMTKDGLTGFDSSLEGYSSWFTEKST